MPSAPQALSVCVLTIALRRQCWEELKPEGLRDLPKTAQLCHSKAGGPLSPVCLGMLPGRGGAQSGLGLQVCIGHCSGRA